MCFYVNANVPNTKDPILVALPFPNTLKAYDCPNLKHPLKEPKVM